MWSPCPWTTTPCTPPAAPACRPWWSSPCRSHRGSGPSPCPRQATAGPYWLTGEAASSSGWWWRWHHPQPPHQSPASSSVRNKKWKTDFLAARQPRGFRLEQALQIRGGWEERNNVAVTRQNIKLKMTHTGIQLFNYDHFSWPSSAPFWPVWVILCTHTNNSLLTECAGYHWQGSTRYSLYRIFLWAACCRYEGSADHSRCFCGYNIASKSE